MPIIEMSSIFIVGLLIVFTSCRRYPMVQAASYIYQCPDGSALNLERWWSEPVQGEGPDVYYLCGGNIPQEGAEGMATNTCVRVDIKQCDIKTLRQRMHTSRQAAAPICITPDQCYFFGGNTYYENESSLAIDKFSVSEGGVASYSGAIKKVRLCHASAVLGEKEILITGGYGFRDPMTKMGPVLDTAIRYNVEDGKGKELKMLQQRGGHSITPLPGGKFLIIGGVGTDSNGAEIFDPMTNKFLQVGSRMKYERKDHRAILASDGRVYIMGGTMGTSAPTEIEVYDPKTGQFSVSGMSLSQGREDAGIANVTVGGVELVILAGGEYKTATGEKKGSSALDIIDLSNQKVYSQSLATTHGETALVVRGIDEGTIRLLILESQRKEGKTEFSQPAEEIVIKVDLKK